MNAETITYLFRIEHLGMVLVRKASFEGAGYILGSRGRRRRGEGDSGDKEMSTGIKKWRWKQMALWVHN